MAGFTRATGDSANPVVYDPELFHDHLLATKVSALFGARGSGKPICVDTELQAERGDTKNYEFTPWKEVEPIRGQNTSILGNEESYDTYTFTITVDQRTFAFRSNGLMTEQRTRFDTREEARRQVKENFAQYNDNVIFKALAGIADTETTTQYQDATDTTDRVNGAGRCIRADGLNAVEVTEAGSDNAALVAAMDDQVDVLSTNLIEEAQLMARTGGTYRMNPFGFDEGGVEKYMLFVHPRAGFHLKDDPSWVQHALRGKDLSLPNMFRDSALGEWENVQVIQNERVPLFLDGNGDYFARNLLVGRDALLLAWAKTMMTAEELIDFGTKYSFAGIEIRGQEKIQFNGVDMGVAQVITSATKLT